MVRGWFHPLLGRRPLGVAVAWALLAGACLVAAILEDDPPPPVPITQRMWMAAAAGFAAFAVGLSWGRWLEGPRAADPKERDDDEA